MSECIHGNRGLVPLQGQRCSLDSTANSPTPQGCILSFSEEVGISALGEKPLPRCSLLGPRVPHGVPFTHAATASCFHSSLC